MSYKSYSFLSILFVQSYCINGYTNANIGPLDLDKLEYK